MNTLHIASGLDLPEESITETFAILAKRGSGKTYTAAVMVEEMITAGLPAAVIDPLGVWWGLRSSADGKTAGLPVVIFGGDHADVPLEQTAGALIAEVIVEQRMPAVLDLSGLSKAAARRFMTDFAERLYHLNRDPLHLVVDEADAFAPQRTARGGERLLGAMEDLVRRGRARGIGVTLITQRPAVLNKDVLTQAEVLVVMRMTGPRDVAAIDEWVRLHASEEEAREVKGSLPSLPVGTAWWWSPGWLGLLKRVQVRQRLTFDSSATPRAGQQRITPRRMADVDIAVLGERIAATAERAKADDPKVLRARIAQLERELATERAKPAPEPIVRTVEVPVLEEGVVDQLEAALAPAVALLGEAQETLAKHRMWAEQQIYAKRAPTPAPTARPARPAQASSEKPVAPVEHRSPRPIGNLSRAERKVLTVLAQHGTRTVTQVALLTGYSHKSGGYRNALSSLRTAGHLEGRGDITATDAGLAALGAYEPLPTGPALLDWWMGQLGKAERTILEALAADYPAEITTDDLAARTGYSATSGGFRNALSRLRSLELASGRGALALSPTIGDGLR